MSEAESKPTPSCSVEVVHSATVNFAMEQCGVPIVAAVRVKNTGSVVLRDAFLEVCLGPDLGDARRIEIPVLAPGESFEHGSVDLRPPFPRLRAVSEAEPAELRWSVILGGLSLASDTRPIRLLAFNEWPGDQAPIELLAAFVTPNQPAITRVLQEARVWLSQNSADDAIVAYQARSAQRARLEVEAVYAAIQRLGLSYVGAPASFERTGQKVRLPDQLLKEQMGNCLDLALLFAASLEQMSFAPLVLVFVGHAIPAVWLIDERFPEGAVADPARVRNQIRLGNLLAFDASTAISGNRPSLPIAVAAAMEWLDDDAKFVAAIDVRVARRARFLPLPIALKDAVESPEASAHHGNPAPSRDTSYAGPSDSRSSESSLATAARAARHAATDPDDPVARRIRRWKERLLDLTLRNRLLAMRRDRNAILLEVPDLVAFENRLAADEEFEILPFPKLDQADPRAKELLEKRTDKNAERERLLADLRARRLHATQTVDDLWPVATKLYRQARTDLEEGGANTLFVVLGLLKWFESGDATDARYAPLLLVPVRLTYEPRLHRIRLRRTEEDVVGNVTLAEKLRRDFALDLGFLAEPLLDDSGVDVAAVFANVRSAIQSMPRFEILEECAVAQFTFGKFLLWRDLEVNAATLLENPLVRHVAEGGAKPWVDAGPLPTDSELDRVLHPKDLPTVVDADSTQLAAVLAAVRGRTFVLQGPPGTGKSQTITNLIAAALAEGKTVLFVAEKKAALDVVYRRLESVGLGDFCLELHSNKASKRVVLESLGRAFERSAASPGDHALGADKLAAARDRLNDYVRVLHGPRSIGRSFHAASARVLELARAGAPLCDLPLPRGTDTLAADLEAALLAAKELGNRAERVVPIAEHPWRDSALTEWSGEREAAIRAGLERGLATLGAFTAARDSMFTFLGANAVDRIDAIDRLLELIALGVGAGTECLPKEVGDSTAFEALRARIESFAAELTTDETDRIELSRRWKDSLLELGDELAVLRAGFEKHATGGLMTTVLGLFTLRAPRKRLAAHAVGELPESALVAKDLVRAEARRERANRLGEMRRALSGELGAAAPPTVADSQAWRAALDRFTNFLAKAALCSAEFDGALATTVTSVLRIASDIPEEPRKALAREAAAVRGALAAFGSANAEIERLAAIESASAEQVSLTANEASIESRLAGLTRLREWCAYGKAEVAAKGAGLAAMCVKLREGAVLPRVVESVVERSWLERFVFLVRDAEPFLREFDGAEQSRRVSEFRALDLAHVRACRDYVQARLDDRVPDTSSALTEESEPGILTRELKKKARHMPLRKLFSRIPNLVLRLKPCFLMSPLSVAQYLTAQGRRFDLVVFDEASQIGTHDSIGSLARGSQAVIVGDSRQLPPTMFFQRASSDDEAVVDEADIEELESVLDEAVASRLPERHLRWHYRSRHEALIRFSNRHYYDDRLFVFPAAHGDVDDLGVKWHPVAGGIYEFASSRTNPIEARALVDWLVARLRRTTPGERTFGVVTFSQPQQILVLDLLDEARTTYPEIEAHFDVDSDEPVFVKNLENVQGDERDEILFSICYGPARDGKVRMNFGPLNQSGGERRLNVAVTRARRALRVFCSLTFDRIDVLRTAAKGVHHLREFLRYVAEEGSGVSRSPGGGDPASEFERAVREALLELGHAVDAEVGCGTTRIDLAVRHPQREGVFVLGVELDGKNYIAPATARDRDRLRPQVLENLGWRLHRIWSSDWWFDRDREIARLDAAVRAAIEASDSAVKGDAVASSPVAETPGLSVEPPTEPIPESKGTPKPTNPLGNEGSTSTPRAPELVEPYVHAKLGVIARDPERLFDPSARVDLERAILEVVAVEAPILEDSVVRDVARAFSCKTVRERVRASIQGAIRGLASAGRLVVRDDFVWRVDVDPATFDRARGADHEGEERAIDEIAVEELAVVARRILAGALSLPDRELARATARAFGVARFGKEADARLRIAIDSVIARGYARRCAGTDAEDERVEVVA